MEREKGKLRAVLISGAPIVNDDKLLQTVAGFIPEWSERKDVFNIIGHELDLEDITSNIPLYGYNFEVQAVGYRDILNPALIATDLAAGIREDGTGGESDVILRNIIAIATGLGIDLEADNLLGGGCEPAIGGCIRFKVLPEALENPLQYIPGPASIN